MSRNRYAVGMVDWRGKAWDFTGDWAAGIISGGVEGLVGVVRDSVAEPLGMGGHLVLGQSTEPLRGSVTFHCRAHDVRDAGEVAADFRRAFSALKSRQNHVRVSSPFGPVTAVVRVDGAVDSPVEDPSWDDIVLNVRVPLVGDAGVWLKPAISGDGVVTVTNTGDVHLWPRIVWSGPGGRVELPSGAVFTLPAVEGQRALSLSRAESMRVVDADGVRDDEAWAAVRAVTPEGVPVGATRQFRVPDGARLVYQEGVLDPWQ
ncbi:hypothetical protein [Corynebacterium cystitidis]|uniref:hypothetical protein n=1 Tax=Corynebacterium cystitidis TaxID=35757 RepID=UPI00211E8496|nr:hypothetical protein [Corynebacterium cystitidis]